MTISEWFNPHNLEHLKAYRHLEKTGMWPSGFLPLSLTMDSLWQVAIAAKLARAWLEHKGV